MFAILFYLLLFTDILYIILNYILIKKSDKKELYNQEKKKIINGKFYKTMKIIIYICLILFLIYIPFGITNFFFSIPYMIFDQGEKLNHSLDIGFSMLYTLFLILLINKIRMRHLINKTLK